MRIRVMLAFSSRILSDAVKRLLDDDDSVEVAFVASACRRIRREDLNASDVVLADYRSLEASFGRESAKGPAFILLDTDCGHENLVRAVTERNVSGLLLQNATPGMLKKAVRSVARGESWIDSSAVKDLVTGLHAVKKPILSGREDEIVSLAGMGLRNREIAERLLISELTVKTHLNRIFRKLGIRTRSELIKHSIKRALVNSTLSGKKGRA
ncbi:MAG: response regulator transcription factor [Deltaproteobacteria bacterium]|nr:response regulator transcription factor [Deltaproteobacteria bacterium]